MSVTIKNLVIPDHQEKNVIPYLIHHMKQDAVKAIGMNDDNYGQYLWEARKEYAELRLQQGINKELLTKLLRTERQVLTDIVFGAAASRKDVEIMVRQILAAFDYKLLTRVWKRCRYHYVDFIKLCPERFLPLLIGQDENESFNTYKRERIRSALESRLKKEKS